MRGDALASGDVSASFKTPNVSEKEYEKRVGKREKKKVSPPEPTPITTSAHGIEQKPDGSYVPERDLTHQDGNVYYAGETGFEAAWSQIVVLQDDWKSGLECQTCLAKQTRNFNGADLTVIRCPECGGRGERAKVGNAELMVRCSECDGRGDIVCPACHGKGGLIALPKSAESEPTSGTVVSVGPQSDGFKLGDRVLFMSFSGNLFRLTVRSKVSSKQQKVSIRILVDRDIRCKMHGYLNFKELDSARALYTSE